MGTFIANSEYMTDMIETLNAARESNVPVILWGAPGTGKTELVRALAARNDLPLEILLGSTMDPTDLSGLPAPVQRDGYQVAENTRPDWADNLMTAGKGCLFLDELNNGTPAVQSVELTLIQNKLVGRHKLPDDVWIIGASNEPEDAADGYELAPPLANRILHLEWNPPVQDWFDGMLASWNEENVHPGVREQRSRFVTFLRDNKGLVQKQPQNDAEAGKAWPSRRSWDNAAKTMGRVTSDNIRIKILTGLVGEAAANAYFSWERNLKLPTHEEVMKDPSAIDWKSLPADALVAIIMRTVSMLDGTNFDPSVKVFIAISDNGQADIASSYVTQLLQRATEIARQEGVKLNVSEEIKKLLPLTKITQKAGL